MSLRREPQFGDKCTQTFGLLCVLVLVVKEQVRGKEKSLRCFSCLFLVRNCVHGDFGLEILWVLKEKKICGSLVV